jgi:hypothetical protein
MNIIHHLFGNIPVVPVRTQPAATSRWVLHEQPFAGQWYIFPAAGGKVLVTVEGDRQIAEHIVELHNRSLTIL